LTGDAFDDNFADSGQVAAEQGENRLLAGELQLELDDVERALSKLDDGTYGACEVCGEPIAEARLDAKPAARFCIAHA
jgi:RNA polymerase-binding transcription factor DksA